MPAGFNTDVLVIGGGLAGARAAQAATEAGATVLLVSKGPMGVAGASARASGGFAAAVGPEDSAAMHAHDTICGGYGIASARQVRAITEAASVELHRLCAEVGGFSRDGQPLQGLPAPMHTAPRSVQYPHAMAQLMGALRGNLKAAGVDLLEDHRVVDLLFGVDRSVSGALLYDNMTGAFQTCAARAVVLACGGCGQLFPVTSNGADATGDGYGVALRAGCALQDMEFIQYTPTAFAAPDGLKGQTIVGTLLTIDGVRLLNAPKERFMERYAPAHLEGADRATLARAIFREVSEGRGTPAGGVFLDATGVSPETFNRHRCGFYDLCLAHGLDPCRIPLETAPAVHTCLGGVQTDDTFKAAANLWVAGEALAGTHGANRLSSNSLTEANVTGWQAGKHAAARALACGQTAPGRLPNVVLPPVGPVVMAELHGRLQALMGSAAGVERDAETLEIGREQLARLQLEHERAAVSGVDDAGLWLDVRNMLMVASAILGAALTRTESRGAHFRTDFPNLCAKSWHGNISCRLDCGRLGFQLEPI